MSERSGSEKGVLSDEDVASFQHLPAVWRGGECGEDLVAFDGR